MIFYGESLVYDSFFRTAKIEFVKDYIYKNHLHVPNNEHYAKIDQFIIASRHMEYLVRALKDERPRKSDAFFVNPANKSEFLYFERGIVHFYSSIEGIINDIEKHIDL